MTPSLEPGVINQESLLLPFDEGGRIIGQPLCYRPVKSMGGVLSFAQVNEGVTFTVSLPKRHLPSKRPSDGEDVAKWEGTPI